MYDVLSEETVVELPARLETQQVAVFNAALVKQTAVAVNAFNFGRDQTAVAVNLADVDQSIGGGG
jgi:hypothetical protein